MFMSEPCRLCFIPQKYAHGAREDALWQVGYAVPSEGVHDVKGNLFHHASVLDLLPCGVQRLHELGILYEARKRFTKEEDALIDKNCEEFCVRHNIDKSFILRHTGFDNWKKHIEFRRRTNMWPSLCVGLETRCAKEVRYRIVRLLTARLYPDRPFKPEDDLQLQQLAKRFSEQVICEVMRRSVGSLKSRKIWLQRRKMFSCSERRKLWNTVCVLVTETDEWGIPHPCDGVWSDICGTMFRCRETLQSEWTAMVTELESLRDAGGIITLEEALNKVAPISHCISAADCSEFIEVLLEEVPHMVTLRVSRDQLESITDKMQQFGITGFHTGRLSEFMYCRYRLGRMLCVLRRRLLRPASLRLSLSTQLRLLSRCLRSLPGAEKNQRFVLRRSHVIKQIEKQMTSENPEWKLSRKLRRYIEGEKE